MFIIVRLISWRCDDLTGRQYHPQLSLIFDKSGVVPQTAQEPVQVAAQVVPPQVAGEAVPAMGVPVMVPLRLML